MKLPVYSIRDNISHSFDSPFLSNNDFTMMRSLAENIIRGNLRNIEFSPKDYDVYKIGEFDLDKGLMIPEVPIKLVSGCKEVIDNYGYRKE